MRCCLFLMLICCRLSAVEIPLFSEADFIIPSRLAALADHQYDNHFIPTSVKKGDIVFVKTEDLRAFFTSAHTEITNQYILLSHCSEKAVDEPFREYLEDEKLAVWFAQNAQITHQKLVPLPRGIENFTSSGLEAELFPLYREIAANTKKKSSLYCCFFYQESDSRTFRYLLRRRILRALDVTLERYRSTDDYMIDMIIHQFVITPLYQDKDGQRPWEVLYLGSIPVINSSAMDPVFDGLPVIIVPSWRVLSTEYLQEELEKLNTRTFQYERLTISYWENKIGKYQAMMRENR